MNIYIYIIFGYFDRFKKVYIRKKGGKEPLESSEEESEEL